MPPAMPCAYHPQRHADLGCPRCSLPVCRQCLRIGICRRCAGEAPPGLDAATEDSLSDPKTLEAAGWVAALGAAVVGAALLPLLVPLMIAGVAVIIRRRIPGYRRLGSAAGALAGAFVVVFPALVYRSGMVVYDAAGWRLAEHFAGDLPAALIMALAGVGASAWARHTVKGLHDQLEADDDRFLRGFLRGGAALAWVATGLCVVILAAGT